LINNIITTQTIKLSSLSHFTFLPLVSHHSARFIFFLFIALLIHSLIIFQISFSLPKKIKHKQKPLDIIINPVKTIQKVKKADYFAQSNQQGGGKTESKSKPANVLPGSTKLPLKKQVKTPVKHLPLKQTVPVKKITAVNVKRSQLTTKIKSKQKAAKLVKKTNKKKSSQSTKKLTKPVITSQYLANLKKQIIDLEADIDLKTRVYSRRSKHKFVNASTAKALDAEYIRQWTRKIERIGNLNYPVQARKNKLSGKLILAVTINPHGKILNIEVRRSSKHKTLDDAAIRIVKLSAPFAPIPDSVLKDNSALVITRTWLFTQKSNGQFIMN
jgi:periplasmic protein TonB